MTPEQDKKLCETFPRLYADRHKSMQESCFHFGFECGTGWFQLIWDLSVRLEQMIEGLGPFSPDEVAPRASQVKEKFGTLRFYMTHSTDEMEAAIDEAERLSEVTCEDCGQSGHLRTLGGWLSTLCDPCVLSRASTRL